jgi:hypothetical protein
MFDEFTTIAHAFTLRGDLAHLALLLWAGSATVLLLAALRELAAANRRLNDFVALLGGLARRAAE